MPALCSWCPVDARNCRQSEDALVEQLNVVLQAGGQPRLDSLAELYAHTDSTLLTTFPELDHYAARRGANYFGVWPYRHDAAGQVQWPEGKGPRIFAYLKPSRGLGPLFDWIAAQGHPTIVVGDGLNIESLRALAKPNLRFQREPLPLQEVGRECDVAILNATHGTTCSLLLEGKPIFQLPHNLEQAVTALRTIKLGAAAQADKDDGTKIVWEFSGFLHHDRYANSAREFAERNRSFRPSDSVARIAAELTRLGERGRDEGM